MPPLIIGEMMDSILGIISVVITIAIAASSVIWALQGRFTKLESNVTNLTNTVATLSTQLANLVTTLSEIKVQEHRLRALEAQVSELRTKYHNLNNTLQRVSAILEVTERREDKDIGG